MEAREVALVWEHGPIAGRIEVTHGDLCQIRIAAGEGAVEGSRFSIDSPDPCRIEIQCGHARVDIGSRATRVTVRAELASFTFMLRDVSEDWPIFLPWCGAAVTICDDRRTFAQIAVDIQSRGLVSQLQHLASEPEETFERAAERTRRQHCETWLGLSRDERIFRIKPNAGYGIDFTIEPRLHNEQVLVTVDDGSEPQALCHRLVLGRGAGCRLELRRHLDDGCLPILHCEGNDGEIAYAFTAFATNEKSPLQPDTLRGTPYLVADGHAAGHMFTDAQKAEFDRLLPVEMNRDEQVVLHLRGTATNTSRTPRYAWFRAPTPERDTRRLFATTHDCATGFSVLQDCERDPVLSVSRISGRSMPDPEMAVLLEPGASADFAFVIPHQPISQQRAALLANADLGDRLDACRRFWREKLNRAASVHLPEPRINDMFKAGLLHLEMIMYGLEPDGTLAATIGWYAPIGTETAPIIMFFDAMGCHDTARRAIQYFLDKQHDDGFIQNYGGYMSETGPVLVGIGEHYRYTRDAPWLRRVMPKAIRSCEYLLRWRKRNMRDDYRGRGFGMLDGKVGDPEDPMHYFFNSGYACMGLQRIAECLSDIDPDQAQRIAAEAEAFRADILSELAECMARSPVIPISDGTWRPTAAPWAEGTGPAALFCEDEACFTHGAFAARDSLAGPLWLVFQEVLAPFDPPAESLLRTHAELFTLRNAAFSQPCYSRHAHAHLRRGEVSAFLKTYYNTMAALADRQTYTWTEHMFEATDHKTHEEAWFLMQTRWMLLMEEADTLHLLRGVPRAWLADGRYIEFANMATYFGPVSLRVESHVRSGAVNAHYACSAGRRPRRLMLRLPHPQGARAACATGGIYDAADETVIIDQPSTEGVVQLHY